jgi:ComF family protein
VDEFAQPVVRCRTCALPLVAGLRGCIGCSGKSASWDQALAAVDYRYPWAGLLLQFKFFQQSAWAHAMASLMRSAPWIEPALDTADLLVPVPLSRQRLRERGFNQSLLLARALDARKVADQLLLRIRDTPAQSTLPRMDRAANVRNAFALDPLRSEQVRGRRVVVVDDVMTSGASLQAACAPLRQAGAAHICTLVFARTVN